VRAAAYERLRELAGAAGGQDHDMLVFRFYDPYLRCGDPVIREEPERERLELLVGAVRLIGRS
jgi:hypothetical protein